MVAYVRTVKTSSAATAVQIVWSSRRGSRNIEHIGSAHDDAELEPLKAAARQRRAAGQMELDLGLGGPGPAAPLEIASSRMSHLWNALCRAYDALGFPQATGSDEDAAVTRSKAAATKAAVARAIAWWTNDIAVAECAVAAEEATGNGPAYPARPTFRRDFPPEPVQARERKIRLRPYSPAPAWRWRPDRCWRAQAERPARSRRRATVIAIMTAPGGVCRRPGWPRRNGG